MFLLPFLPYLLCTVSAHPGSKPFREALRSRQSYTNNALQVDLGYGIYQGFSNSTTGINTWRGIRFAAPPTGDLRWQRPQAPPTNRSSVIQATEYNNVCYQVGFAHPGDRNAAAIVGGPTQSDDCLFLNVQSPANASNLPVLVWIHGGGYGAGSNQIDLTDLMRTNNNNFVTVAIQYRLGPFGFLASDEVYRNGVVNAGLLDQHFALQWVQEYIRDFGGDPSAVTIAGVSAGGGSVMLQDMAYGGSLGDSLFRGSIPASPYLPKQYDYNAWIPSQGYYAFAAQAGCPVNYYGKASQTIFDCLMSKDAATLQNASITVTAQGVFGTWVFLPVTDGIFIQSEPSTQLVQKKLNGHNVLAGNNANEGPAFVPNITTQNELVSWLHDTLPEFDDSDIAKVLLYYPSSNKSDSETNIPKVATSGVSGPSALNQSSVASGQQQRAYNLYAELTFICPSYWLAEAYSGEDRKAYKYQFSALPALHGSDQNGYLGPLGGAPTLSLDFQRAMMTIWGNFITKQNPSISNALAAGASSNQTVTTNAASDWPAFTNSAPYQINLNQTGGTVSVGDFGTQITEPGLRNDFTLANAYTWEAGRGARCDFWKSAGKIIPA